MAYSPGTGSPAFDKDTFEYLLTLETGTTSTAVNLTKEPGDLTTDILHVSNAAGSNVTICNDCAYLVQVGRRTQPRARATQDHQGHRTRHEVHEHPALENAATSWN